MSENQKKKRFLNLPKYIGGTEAFREFIKQNLKYPKEALEAKVEGSVVVGYEINDDGIVQNPHVMKGIGHGCNEEAVRVVGMLRFEKVKNRGIRVKMTTKTNIHFKLPNVSISYSVAKKKEPDKPRDEPETKPVTYGYTITF